MAPIDGFDATATQAVRVQAVAVALRSGARRTSGGEAAAGHTGSTEGAGDSNHGEGVGLRVEMNWVMRRWMEGDGGSCD
jgi:hypothetical protein